MLVALFLWNLLCAAMGTGYRENALIDPSAYDSPVGLSLEQVHVYVRHGANKFSVLFLPWNSYAYVL
jgi:hypothetical protein